MTIADNIKMTGIKNNLNEKICPINTLIFSGLFFSLATSLVAIKGNPNSIINKIKMPNVWAKPTYPNSSGPSTLAINGSMIKASR